ncbi:MAG: hypothetical protein AABX33_06760 [Nanoarchaeota archaeon]
MRLIDNKLLLFGGKGGVGKNKHGNIDNYSLNEEDDLMNLKIVMKIYDLLEKSNLKILKKEKEIFDELKLYINKKDLGTVQKLIYFG